MSAMDVDTGVEEKKGGEAVVPATAAVSTERTQKGKGEGDRNIMLHPVCVCLFCLVKRCFSAAYLAVLRLLAVYGQTGHPQVCCAETLDFISKGKRDLPSRKKHDDRSWIPSSPNSGAVSPRTSHLRKKRETESALDTKIIGFC